MGEADQGRRDQGERIGNTCATMAGVGLGRVKTKVPVARTEYFERIAHQESQIILRPYGLMPR